MRDQEFVPINREFLMSVLWSFRWFRDFLLRFCFDLTTTRDIQRGKEATFFQGYSDTFLEWFSPSL
jgi:hypothetical protein